MLEALINFNKQWLADKNIQLPVTELPLFYSEPTLSPHIKRKVGSRSKQFRFTFSAVAFGKATQSTIDLLNSYQSAVNLPTFDEQITPRRCAKPLLLMQQLVVRLQ